MSVGTALDEWVLRNAASREDPASGFELLAAWLDEEICATTTRIRKWLDVAVTAVLAVVVGTLAARVFATLTALIYAAV